MQVKFVPIIWGVIHWGVILPVARSCQSNVSFVPIFGEVLLVSDRQQHQLSHICPARGPRAGVIPWVERIKAPALQFIPIPRGVIP